MKEGCYEASKQSAKKKSLGSGLPMRQGKKKEGGREGGGWAEREPGWIGLDFHRRAAENLNPVTKK